MGSSAQEAEGKYTKSDRRIMDFVEDYTDEFLFMSIGQLAGRLGMSEATVSRCARHLGYRDFKEMKNDLIQKKAGKGAAGKLAGTLMKDQGFDVENWFDFQRECLERTREQLDMGQFQEAVQRIGSARNIYIHAKNASLAAARLLFFRLRRLGFQASLIPSGGSEVLEGIAHAGEGDLAILFSFSKVCSPGAESGCEPVCIPGGEGGVPHHVLRGGGHRRPCAGPFGQHAAQGCGEADAAAEAEEKVRQEAVRKRRRKIRAGVVLPFSFCAQICYTLYLAAVPYLPARPAADSGETDEVRKTCRS